MKRLVLPLSLFVLGLALAGCAGGGPRSSRAVLVQLSGNTPVHAQGFLSPTRLAFYTSGSGGCPSVPDKLTVKGPHNIRLDLTTGSYRHGRSGQMVLVAKPPPSGYCVTDLTLTLVIIAINPKQIDVHHRLKVSLYYPLDEHPHVFTVRPL